MISQNFVNLLNVSQGFQACTSHVDVILYFFFSHILNFLDCISFILIPDINRKEIIDIRDNDPKLPSFKRRSIFIRHSFNEAINSWVRWAFSVLANDGNFVSHFLPSDGNILDIYIGARTLKKIAMHNDQVLWLIAFHEQFCFF